ncbi:hypothetical protein [Mycobacterium sp. shizuoka-1]|uniref:hypothetical protein n=1 Tax=Mycobacterium sp. shizuoka-1 TaxID=2039281 RepID=UPI000C064296|nr:hypothetical protein [Mycobacterium sp. shizuoka-1]GAY14179.1 hypothetical protein MSZK_09050 [Mycobacterium sp. shizuoka-1]
MTETRQHAEDLVANALSQRDITMDDLLGELDMPIDFEPDARLRNERDSDDINFYGSLAASRKGIIDGRPQGLTEAMTADNDEPLRMLTRNEVTKHRFVGSENVNVRDPHQELASKAEVLPPWDIHDPDTANVQRGLVAGRPDEIYVIRGRFSARDLLGMVWSQRGITTGCGLRISVDCDRDATPPNDRERSQRVWGVFTVPHGEYLVYFTTCANCYLSLWHMDGEATNFDVIDPKFD